MNLLSVIWDVSPELFPSSSFAFRWYGLLFALGFFFAYALMYHIFKKENIRIRILDLLTFWMFVATLIGARLGHVFFYEWSYYKDHIGEIFMVWEGGLASHGAAVAIIIMLLFFARHFKLNLLWLFDRLAIVIPVVAAFVRLGNLMNSEIYGVVTDLPWGFVFVNDKNAGDLPRHPTQLYEALSYLLITLVLYLVWRKKKSVVPRGLSAGILLVMLFTARFLIEFVKTEQVSFEKDMSLFMGQWLSIPFVLFGAFLIFWSLRKKPGLEK